MTSVLMGKSFPLTADKEGFAELEEAGMIRVDPTRQTAHSLPSSPSYQYDVNDHADMILHIPSLHSLRCASYDTADQCRRKSIGFTRMSMMSNNGGSFSGADLLADSLQQAVMAATIQRVSSPTDISGSRSSKNPRDMLITRLKSVKLKPEDLVMHTKSVDECIDKKGDDEIGVDLDGDQTSTCSAIIPTCENDHLICTSSTSTEAMFELQDRSNLHYGVVPSADCDSLREQVTPRQEANSHSEGKVSSFRNTIAAARKIAGGTSSCKLDTGKTILPALNCSPSSKGQQCGSLVSPSSTNFSHSQYSLLQPHNVSCDHSGIPLHSRSLNAPSFSPRLTPRRLLPPISTANVFGLSSYHGSGHSTPRLTPST